MPHLTMRMLFTPALIALMMSFSNSLLGQVFSNKEVGKKNAELIDSLKASEYPYILPILGKKATKAGFDLPYSAGININYLWQESDIIIDNLLVGFNHGPLHDVDEIIRFDNARSTASAVNIRPDIWLLPFLSVYGVFAKSSPSTAIKAGVWVPDADGNWSNVMPIETTMKFDATTMGFGFTPTIGVAGGFLALDMNFTWSDIDQLEKPAFATVFGPRFGKNFKLKKKQQTVAIWAGGFRLKINSETTGDINLRDLFPADDLQARVDAGLSSVATKQVAVDDWWSNLTTIEQKNPGNVARYETANRALAAAGNFFNGIDESLNDETEASVQYSLDKRQKNMWNFIVGAQYQHNKHIILRAEYGFLGAREQLLTGLQYRFGL
jgi:hypothetical protein